MARVKLGLDLEAQTLLFEVSKFLVKSSVLTEVILFHSSRMHQGGPAFSVLTLDQEILGLILGSGGVQLLTHCMAFHCTELSIITSLYQSDLTLVLLNPDIPCLCKQCRSRSVGF